MTSADHPRPVAATPLPVSGGPVAPPDDSLDRVLGTLSDLVSPDRAAERPGLVPAVRGELARAILIGAGRVAADLRREMSGWDSALDQVRRLSGSKYLQHDNVIAGLVAELGRARRDAEQMADELESLGVTALAPPDAPGETAPGRTAIEPAGRAAGEPAENGGDDPRTGAVAASHQADRLRAAGKFEPARSLYEEAVRFDPGYRPAHVGLGLLAARQRRLDDAVRHFTAALELDAGDAETYWRRGTALAYAGRLDEAVADCDRALDLDPGLTQARFCRALVHRRRDDFPLALADLDQVLAELPDNSMAWFQRGRIYFALNDWDRAAADFEAALHYYSGAPGSTGAAEIAAHLAAAKRAISANDIGRSAAETVDVVAVSAADAGVEDAEPAAADEGTTAEVTSVDDDAAADADPDPASAKLPVPAGRRGLTSAASGAPGPESDSFRVPVKCPGCGAGGRLSLQRMDRVIHCRGCGGHFLIYRNGTMEPVVRGPGGKWVTTAAGAEGTSGFRWVVSLGAVAAMLLVSVLGWRLVTPARASAERELPREVNARIELFARSWVHGDLGTMRRLTVPALDKTLFAWYTRHRAPAEASLPGEAGAAEPAVEVHVVNGRPHLMSVRAVLPGLTSAGGRGGVELAMTWEERGETWYFTPPPR